MKLSVITLPITILGFAHASNPECIEYAEEIKSKRSEEKTDSKVAIIPLSGELWEKITQIMEERLDELKRESNSNLLEIKLKDTDSVPEVWYKGERLDELPKGLVDVSYHWKTDQFTNDDRGANDITIQYFSSFNDKYPDMKTIGHKRDM